MVVRIYPTLSPGYSAKLTEAMTLSPSSFCKRYQGTSEPIADTETESDESEDEGTDSESEEDASKDQQQQAVKTEDIAADEPLGLGYRAARLRALERAEGTVPSTYEVGQSFGSTPDQQIAGETPTQTHTRLHVRTTWEDPKDSTVYMDIECDIPLVRSPAQTSPSPVGTPASPEWFPESLSVSPAIPSLVATPAPAVTLYEDDLL
ncbi:hypothetical protein Tco_0193968 [Tanacetum coccineum]